MIFGEKKTHERKKVTEKEESRKHKEIEVKEEKAGAKTKL